MSQSPKFKINDAVWFLDDDGFERRSTIVGVLDRYEGYYYDTGYAPGKFVAECELPLGQA